MTDRPAQELRAPDRPDVPQFTALYALLESIVQTAERAINLVYDAEARATPPAAPLDVLRDQIRAAYNFQPDDSRGEGHRNSGVATALHVIEEAAGRDFAGRCQRSADPMWTSEVWCLTHGGPMPRRVLWCDFAERTWEWRDAGPLDPPVARLQSDNGEGEA